MIGVHNIGVSSEVFQSTATSLVESITLFSPLQLLYSGSAAVSVFFVISGFLVARSTMLDSSPKLFKNIGARYLRLALPVTVALLVYFAFEHVRLMDFDRLSQSYVYGFGLDPFGTNGLTLLGTLQQGMIGAFLFMDRSFIPILWIVSFTFFATVFIMLCCFLVNNRYLSKQFQYNANLIIAIILTALLWKEIVVGFALGYLLASLQQLNVFELNKQRLKWICVCAMIGLFSFVLKGGGENMFNYLSFNIHQLDMPYVVYSFAAFFLVALIIYSDSIKNLLSNPLMVWVGVRSYSILLGHTTCMLSFGFAAYYETRLSVNFAFAAYVFVTYITSILLGVCIYEICERPVKRLLKNKNSLPPRQNA
jgi:peptidoglycan/LPS O-acetylase OafA/YrhL